jgi:hypothetical protein
MRTSIHAQTRAAGRLAWALLLLLGIGFALSVPADALAVPRANLQTYLTKHQKLHDAFAQKIEKLADDRKQQGQDFEADEIRKLAEPFDPWSLEFDPLPAAPLPEIPLNLPADERGWRVRLRQAQQEYAKELYMLSQTVLKAGHASFAYNLVRETVKHDPDHTSARHILGYERVKDAWVTPYAAQMLRKGYVNTKEFGWLKPSEVERYEKGERRVGTRWMTAAQEAQVRRDFSQAWEVRTDHFLIRTNQSLEIGLELGRELEDFYSTFFQVFASFINTREEMRQLFEGTARGRRIPEPMEIDYFRDKAQYVQRLRAITEQQIEKTNAIYFPPTARTGKGKAYSFYDPNGVGEAKRTLFHEATHMMFSEARRSRDPIAMKANFWVVEGIACYMESFLNKDGRFTVGDPNYLPQGESRFHVAKYRYTNDKYYVPLKEFTSMGMYEFQNAKELTRNYTQASGLVHFFMHYNDGVYREELIQHLSDIYSMDKGVRNNPRSLEELTGVPFADLDRQYGEYIEHLGEKPAAPVAAQ